MVLNILLTAVSGDEFTGAQKMILSPAKCVFRPDSPSFLA